MKQFLLPMLALLLGANMYAQTQQAPLYLLFNSNCMNQLEYRYTYSGASSLAYSFSPNVNQLFLLSSGSNGINTPTLPNGTLDCKDIRLDQNFLDMVNKLQRQVYMVHQTQQGYLLMPIIMASQIERNGSYYFFRHPNYTFALDTLNLVYQANLSSAGSPNYVYFSGLQIKDCMYQYTFHSEPLQQGREKSDFDFIPGIGFITNRSGMTANEAEANQMRLWYINGMAVDDYISGKCNAGNTSAKPKIPANTLAGTPPVNEPNRETATSSPTPIGPPVAFTNCPEQPSPGIHIVQKSETLLSISRAYKIPLKTLVAWNQISNPDQIEICQKIYVTDPAKMKLPVQPSQPPATLSAKTPETTATAPVHVVQKGETVSGISRRYGFTEARFRALNNMPASGDVTIYPGQKLIISDCDKVYIDPNINTAVDPSPASQPPATQPSLNHPGLQPNTGNDGSGLRPLEMNATPPPTVVGTQPAIQPVSRPNQFLETSVLGSNTTPATPAEPVKKATYYQEYVVQQGDTMNAIAIKFKTSVQELCLLNNKDQNETLIAGQRLLIPKQ